MKKIILISLLVAITLNGIQNKELEKYKSLSIPDKYAKGVELFGLFDENINYEYRYSDFQEPAKKLITEACFAGLSEILPAG